VDTQGSLSKSAVTMVIGVVLVWSLASLTLTQTDLGAFARDPVGARIGPMTVLEAIASDRPMTTFDARPSEHPDALPAVVSADAGTRSALLWVIGDVRLPASFIATSRLASGIARRGPPFSFVT
jgi:hypothetical protein